MFRSTKAWTPEDGLSCTFRQWRAESHCRFLHGYALGIELTFEADTLDVRNWVVDFGSLKSFKQILTDNLDHKTLVASDDPLFKDFQAMHDLGMIDMVQVEATGCEKLAEMLGDIADGWLRDAGYKPRVRLVSCKVWEHDKNSATWFPPVNDI